MDATFATKAPILAPIQVSQRAKYTMRIAVEREKKHSEGEKKVLAIKLSEAVWNGEARKSRQAAQKLGESK